MPQAPDLSKYLDAGAQFVAMTRAQARRRAQELVASGQLAQGQVQAFVDDLVSESRRRTDEMLDVVRKEVQRQVQTLGIATKDDLARLEARLAKQAQAAKKSAKKPAKKPTKKSAAKKAASNGARSAKAS
ncbi:MAG: hypothetical protein FJW88_10710 [Actinobacteria bacterium]|nr:hypothetical protein [Actinomycetota bacterium]